VNTTLEAEREVLSFHFPSSMTRVESTLGDALRGRYVIERELGRGGMATVYLASDIKHSRQVAIKVLHPELSQALGAERFVHEIAVAARLQHPYILSVHDSGAHEGLLWYAMPYVAGESLRQRLTREPQLALDEAVRIATEVAEALVYAHGQGIVHRDIKPENILLSEHHSVIADFGLARALDVAGGDRLTQSGIVLGTPAYMSPEQASSDARLDGRSDQYALGCVLYEMLAGEPPFTGRTAQAIIARRFSEPVPSLRVLRDVPEAVERAVARALARSPADRFPDTARFAEALNAALAASPGGAHTRAIPTRVRRRRRLTIALAAGLAAAGLLAVLTVRRHPATMDLATPVIAPPTVQTAIRLAVLPFENLGDSTQAYFADGVADAVRAKLVRLHGLEVIARASSNLYRESTKPPEAVARELGVRYLLTGTVRWAKAAGRASRVQVSPELMEVKDTSAPASRWQDTFEAPMSDVFRVQTDIAAEVARALDLELGSDEQDRIAERPTRSLAAYDAYLKGEAVSNAVVVAEVNVLQQAARLYQQAVTLDPTFVEAWSQLSRTRSLLYANGTPDPATAAAARAAADRAVGLAPDRPEGWLALGDYFDHTRLDSRVALEHYARGQQLAPRSAVLLASMAAVEQSLGRWEPAVQHLRQAISMDPRSSRYLRDLGWALLWLRRDAEAREFLDQAQELSPTDLFALTVRAMVSLAQGDLAGARTLIRPPEGVDSAAVVAQFGNTFDLYWVLDRAQQALLVQLTPAAFGGNRAAWAIVLAQTYFLRDESDRGRAYADSARLAFEEQLRAAPNDAQLHIFRGLALAYLGRRAEAIREAERGAALLPLSKNVTVGAYYHHQVARVYLIAGEPDRALALLEQLLVMPYYLTPAWLRIDPNFAPLRGNPRFERLAKGIPATT
jgi:eukaryotic-like serine/threonine-protein kinase